MTVYVSNMLAQALVASGANQQTLINQFTIWINSQKLNCTVFGKDGLNRGSKYLAHVHMRPVIPAIGTAPQSEIDEATNSLGKWKKFVSRGSLPKSDRYLFYAHNGKNDYLLIYIVNNPGAHDFLQNPTASDVNLLKQFEAAADHFWHTDAYTI
jgi:hypothetical protein